MYIHFSDNKVQYEIHKSEYVYEIDSLIILSDVIYDKNKSFVEIQKKIITNPEYKNIENIVFGGFFIVIIDKKNNKVIVYRDVAGIKTGYFHRGTSNNFYIGNNVHEIAKKAGISEFNGEITDMLLMMEFIPDGKTIYQDVSEFKMGCFQILNFNGEILKDDKYNLELSKLENELSISENILKLRESITKTAERLVSTNNIIYLSGGIDSCVMMAAVDDVVSKSNIHSISFKVKGTNQDETPYAKSFADYLNITNEIIEIDPHNKSTYKHFEERILSLNNPYIGYWIFSPNQNNLDLTYFAGQDTRLHTPSVNSLDKLIFSFYSKNRTSLFSNGITREINNLYSYFYFILKAYKSSYKAIKYSDRIICALDIEKYIDRYFFKLYPQKLRLGFSELSNYEKIKENYRIDLNNISSPRALYNQIVETKWAEQYTDDIRYMQDMAKTNNTYIQMPFYDIELARFSSSIPFNYAAKFTKGTSEYSAKKVNVNKVLLREAFKDKLNPEVLTRKKAVSTTSHLMFNGALGEIIQDIIKEDLSKSIEKSFIKKYKYDKIFANSLNLTSFDQSDYSKILKIYYLATLCVYNKNLSQ